MAYRDSASGPAQTESRTVFDGNGASCALAASMQTTATPDDPPCVAVLVDGTSAGMGPLITNSVLSANRGAEETALWIQGPAVTRAYNDLFDVGTPPDPAFEPTRKAVRLDYVADGGVELVNDIFLVHGTPPATDDGSALALREYETDCGSHLAAFEYNLLFFEGDVLDTSWDPQYVQVGTPSYPVGWHSGDINFLIPEHGRHNVPADPVLVMPADPWLRFQTRLSAVSPARDRGVVQEGIPTKDIDGDDRVPEVCAGCSTAAIDIGHDEYMP